MGYSRIFAGVLPLALLSGSLVAAEPATVLKLKGRELEMVESASYNSSSKAYQVRKTGATVTYAEKDVEYVKPPKPAGFDQTQDIPQLEAVLQANRRLWWDVAAFERLMPLYIKNAQHARAVELYREMLAYLGASMPPGARCLFWEALAVTNPSTLEKELLDAVTHGSRETSAWAYLARGDLLAKQDKRNEALVDGYMRTLVLFDDVKATRKDALQKTVQAMTDLGDNRAEKFRKILREEFPDQQK
ncbi:MAG: hypothetical protein C0404_11380 [Verrucomicrobia bacterium]|nr:hypothetical protein [Verrucomicrobiota bacterium]